MSKTQKKHITRPDMLYSMKITCIPLCLCMFLLTACNANQEPETDSNSETGSTPPVTENSETPDENPEITEDVPETTLPADLVIPEKAAYCQIEHSAGADTYHFYDEHDNEILYMIGSDEDSRIITSYEYDSDGMIVTEKTKDYFGETECRYTYNDNKTIRQCDMKTDGEADGYFVYEYDKHGQKKKEAFVDTRGVCMYTISYKNKYDDEGRLISQKNKSGGVMATEVQYEYDEYGNVIHQTIRSVLLNMVVTEDTYTYDAMGRKLTQEQNVDDVTIFSEFEYVYF